MYAVPSFQRLDFRADAVKNLLRQTSRKEREAEMKTLRA
jgi:hypothetical protein